MAEDDPVTPTVTLNNGLKMPSLGLGTYKLPEKEVCQPILDALNAGYRLIDTATFYRNEGGGRAIRQSGLPREEVFVTTKMWDDEQVTRDAGGSSRLRDWGGTRSYLVHCR